MEAWVPLFDIFLNSPCPETEASQWLQQSFNPSSTTSTITTTNSFLSLLTKPTDAIVVDSSSSSSSSSPSITPRTKRFMWIQTLPGAVQARILSFLTFDHQRFCARELSKLARNVLSDGKDIDFWVKRAAQQLLDAVPDSNYEWVSCLTLDSEEERVDDDFGSLPDWLRDAASANSDLFLPWLPLSADELNTRVPFGMCGGDDEDSMMEIDEDEMEKIDETGSEVNVVCAKSDPISPETEKMAVSLKSKMLNIESTSKALELANEIRQVCTGRGGDSLAVLNLIEPWKVDDETASILISHLSDGSEEELGWPSYVLCSIVLPKLFLLKEPASRVLVAATIDYCKQHQRAAVSALLFPLILHKEGINNSVSDVITRILKECLHPAHVSAFCQNLLCGEGDTRKLICLSCHKSLVSKELVWTEPLFNLLQNILNHNVRLTQDSVHQLVYRVQESTDRFSESLKFGNFLLCFFNKCAPLLKSHKNSLAEVVGLTNTLVTKSLLSKLASL